VGPLMPALPPARRHQGREHRAALEDPFLALRDAQGEGAGDREQAVGATRRFGDSTGKEVVWREPFRKRRNRAGDNG